MKITHKDLIWAANQGIISLEQLEKLTASLATRQEKRPGLNLISILYYTGALIIILAMAWFLTISWEACGGWGIMLISLIYAVCFAACGKTLWSEKSLKIPGGLLITVTVCMIPLIVYGLERITGLWPQGDPGAYQNYHIFVKGSWFAMELSTIAAALIALRYVKFPFLTAPIAFSLWYMSMDMTPLLVGKTEFSWDERLWVSLFFGLAMLAVAYYIDGKHNKEEDYGFWLYLFGTVAFWGGLSLMNHQSRLAEVGYVLVNTLMLLLAPYLKRPVVFIFGLLGILTYFLSRGWGESADLHHWLMIAFGTVTSIAAYVTEIKVYTTEIKQIKAYEVYVTLFYLIGSITLWAGITFLNRSNEFAEFAWCIFNVLYMAVSVLFQRRIYLALGSFGVLFYLCHLAYNTFKNSLMFPLVLSGIGISIIYLGVKYQKNKQAVESFALQVLPENIKKLLPLGWRN